LSIYIFLGDDASTAEPNLNQQTSGDASRLVEQPLTAEERGNVTTVEQLTKAAMEQDKLDTGACSGDTNQRTKDHTKPLTDSEEVPNSIEGQGDGILTQEPGDSNTKPEHQDTRSPVKEESPLSESPPREFSLKEEEDKKDEDNARLSPPESTDTAGSSPQSRTAVQPEDVSGINELETLSLSHISLA
jgi:hypothetical protein